MRKLIVIVVYLISLSSVNGQENEGQLKWLVEPYHVDSLVGEKLKEVNEEVLDHMDRMKSEYDKGTGFLIVENRSEYHWSGQKSVTLPTFCNCYKTGNQFEIGTGFGFFSSGVGLLFEVDLEEETYSVRIGEDQDNNEVYKYTLEDEGFVSAITKTFQTHSLSLKKTSFNKGDYFIGTFNGLIKPYYEKMDDKMIKHQYNYQAIIKCLIE